MRFRGIPGLPAARRERRMVASLSATTILLWVGASAILPLLPSYLRREGSSTGLVGLIMSAYFAASVLTQYPTGRLSDRVGRRPVVIGGLFVFAAGSVGFARARAPALAILFRAMQGIGAGAVTVASAAAIGTLIGPQERGGAFGALYGSQMLALAVGPLVGSVVGASSMKVLFLAAAVAAVLAAAPVMAVLPAGRATLVGSGGAAARRLRRASFFAGLGGNGAYIGVLLVFAASGWFAGSYETCWTLLLRLRGASDFDVGLSWTLFALPFAVLSVPAGRVAGRVDRRVLTIAAMVSNAAFCITYPLLHNVALLVGLGSLEALGAVFGPPPALLILTDHTPPDRQGAAQGALETSRTAATALAAALAGALFGVAPIVPFALASGVGFLGALLVLLAWRGVPGHGVARAAAAELFAAERGSGAPETPARGTSGA